MSGVSSTHGPTGGIPFNLTRRGNGPPGIAPEQNPQAKLANEVISNIAQGSVIKEPEKLDGPGINILA